MYHGKNHSAETRSQYMEDMDSNVFYKAEIALSFFPKNLTSDDIVLDIGCCTGELLAYFAQKNPSPRYVGLDISSEILQVAQQRHGKLRFLLAEGSDIPLANDSVKVITLSSVIHEIWSYSTIEYQSQILSQLFSEINRVLQVDGRVIIKDPAKPNEPDEWLYAEFSVNNGENPPQTELFTIDPQLLSTNAKYQRFLQEFTFSFPSYPEEHQVPTGYVLAPAWYLSEFLRHKNLAITPEYWKAEMQERYGILSPDELSTLFESHGLSTLITGAYFNPSNHAASDSTEVRLWNLQGEQLEQSERLPTNLIGVAEKRHPDIR